MIERRIGLLFACFLLLLVLAIGRAAWVQGVQGGGLSADAQSQQTQTVTIPGQRGRILDRKGRELAVSEDAADVIATPYQVKDPARAARRLAPLLHVPEARDPSRRSPIGSSGFAYLARQVDLPTADRVRKLKLAGDRHRAVEPAGLPGGQARRPGDRDRGGRRPGAHRARGGRRQICSAPPTASARWCSTGSARRSSATRLSGAQQGQDLQADDRRRASRHEPRRCSRTSPRPTSRRAPRRSSWTRATPRSWRWPTGPGSIPSDPSLGLARGPAEHGHRLHL